MPILFLLVGILLIIVAINDKMQELGALVKEDFRPSNGGSGFGVWIVAIFVVGSLGYIKAAKPIANAMVVLIVVSMLLANRGFFDNFSKALNPKG